MSFSVKTQQFEGPLDLLLDLIEKRKLFINDISLAEVTDDFISHVRQFDSLPMGESAHFILVASTLLLIKSRSLLPELNLTEEEKGDIRDLETRLKIYKRIKEASKEIAKIFGQEIIWTQSHALPTTQVFVPNPEFSAEKARLSLLELINKLPQNQKENLPKVMVEKVISLEEMISNLTDRINRHLRMSFKEFSGEHRNNRVNIIVSFLAMLELVKQGIVQVSQESSFGDIQIETKDVGLPRY